MVRFYIFFFFFFKQKTAYEIPLCDWSSDVCSSDLQPLALQPREIHTLPYLDLVEPWTSAIDAAPPARRLRSLDKHRRWLERRCRLRIDLLENLSEVMDAFESLARFLHARWRDRDRGSILDNPRTLRFHRH